MQEVGFYIVELPVITRRNGNHKQKQPNETYFLHGNGCKDWVDCLTCPKKDCDWQPYPKTKRRSKLNHGEA